MAVLHRVSRACALLRLIMACSRRLILCLWVALLMAPSPGADAQPASRGTFVGTVRDAETGAALPGAHVFIAASMLGTTTDSTGHFRLAGIPRGAHRVYVSMLGYASATIDTLVQNASIDTLAVRLQPTVLSAGEATVTAERDPKWHDRLEKFERLFIGTSARADQCTLQNPEVLSFETKWWGRFSAHAREPLIIDNRALGYRIRYHLKAFNASGGTVRWDGEPFFQPLTPRDSAEAARWAAERQTAYAGSLRHFLRALLARQTREEGFVVYRHPSDAFRPTSSRFRVSADRLLDPRPDPSLSAMNFFGRLEIIYRHEPETDRFLRWQGTYYERGPRSQTSYLELNEHPVTIDADGEIVEPYGATAYGYFAFERLADAVPSGYRPRTAAASHPPR
jgi:hypothetical protein